MASSLNGTGLTFSSGQTLNAVPVTSLNGQTGDITNTSYGAIGSYVVAAYNAGTTLALNSTTAGSNLYYCGTSQGGGMALGAQGSANYFSAGGTSMGLSGTWRNLNYINASDWGSSARGTSLWVRIS